MLTAELRILPGHGPEPTARNARLRYSTGGRSTGAIPFDVEVRTSPATRRRTTSRSGAAARRVMFILVERSFTSGQGVVLNRATRDGSLCGSRAPLPVVRRRSRVGRVPTSTRLPARSARPSPRFS